MIWSTVGATVAVMVLGVLASLTAEGNATDAAIQPALNNAGVTSINLPEPNISLVNQNGKSVSLSDFRGKAVLLTFLDPVCQDDCPLIAAEMKQADKLLGAYASQVQMVAIVANPVFHSVKDAQHFDQQDGLNDMSNWSYLTSPNLTTLRQVWHDFAEYVSVPKLGMVAHAENLYFISPQGKMVWLATKTGDASLDGSYTSFMADYIDKLLGVSQPVVENNTPPAPQYIRAIPHPRGFDLIHMISSKDGWALATKGSYQQVLSTSDGGTDWTNVTPKGITQAAGLLLDAQSSSEAWVMVPPFEYRKHAALFETTNGAELDPTSELLASPLRCTDRIASAFLVRIICGSLAHPPRTHRLGLFFP